MDAPVYSPLFTGVFWNALDYELEDVDRIEALTAATTVEAVAQERSVRSDDVERGDLLRDVRILIVDDQKNARECARHHHHSIPGNLHGRSQTSVANISPRRERCSALPLWRMATQCSFDVTSNVDLQEVDNALNQARKEVAQRYDFKGSKSSIDFDQRESKLVLVADDEFKLNALWEIVSTRLVRRNVPVKNLTRGPAQPAASSTVRQEVALQQGIPTEKARDIVKFIKDAKLKKVQAAIQGEQLRISSASRDDLQEVMRLLREQDFGVALQFGNYRG
jgi:cyclic-di-GMP-binding protein